MEPGTRIGVQQTLIPPKKWLNTVRIGGETWLPCADWPRHTAENRVAAGSGVD